MSRPAIRFPRIVRMNLDSLPESYRDGVNAALAALADRPYEAWPKESVNGFAPPAGIDMVRVPPDLLVFVRRDAAGDLNVLQVMFEEEYHHLRAAATAGVPG